MPRGGARPNSGGKRAGAGRPKGSATVKTREVADRAARDGITPLEVMLEAMRHHREKGDLDNASRVAKDAAPYCHPRLQAVELMGADGGPIQAEVTVQATLEERLAPYADVISSILSRAGSVRQIGVAQPVDTPETPRQAV